MVCSLASVTVLVGLYNSAVMKWPELGVVAFVCCIDKVGNGVALAPFLILS